MKWSGNKDICQLEEINNINLQPTDDNIKEYHDDSFSADSTTNGACQQ